LTAAGVDGTVKARPRRADDMPSVPAMTTSPEPTSAIDPASTRRAIATRALAWVDSAYDPLALVDLDLVLRYVNPSFGRWVAVDPDLCIGRRLFDLVPVRNASTRLEELIRRSGEECNRLDAEVAGDDGTSIFVISARPDCDGDDLLGYVVAARDVTAARDVERTLRDTEVDYRTLAENLPDVIVRYDHDCRVVYRNDRAATLAGREIGDELAGSNRLVPAELLEYERLVRHCLATGEPSSFELTVPGPRQHVFDVLIRAELAGDGTVNSVLTIGRDVTDLVQAREMEAAREREFRSLAENASDYICRWAPDGTVLYANPAYAAMAGVAAVDLVGAPAEWTGDERLSRFAAVVHDVIEHGRPRSVEEPVDDPQLGQRVHHVKVVPERDRTGTLVSVLGIGRDVTDIVRHRDELRRLARTDALTGIPNRQVLYERVPALLDRAQREGTPVALLLLDLDGFKHVNDRFGHRAGDDLIRAAAARLATCIREDDLLVRLGGDEFVLVIADVRSEGHVDRVADRARLSLSEISALDGLRVARVDASVGVAMFPRDGMSVDELLARADMAMYEAKRNGRARVEYFRAELTAALDRRRAIEHALLQADFDAELHVHVQPVFRLDDERLITGGEVLARWHHPQFGALAPSEFIPLAEESGRIVDLGRWVMRRAAELAVDCNTARRDGPPISLGVNVSTRQFALDDVAAAVLAACTATGCDPRWLVVELTESLLLEDSASVQGSLAALRALGVEVAIDDFGMGYSALHYLARFPVDHLKIDRSFVAGIGSSDRRSELVRAFVALADALGLSPIAEGIETPEQLAFLRELGCPSGQGYLLGRPVPSSEFVSMVSRRADRVAT
jgi:diguanylate cyclase (GGDEF)-like protein/PAS domain S-box-containing protein